MTYIIMLNWNNLPDSIECLQSIYRLEGEEFKTIIIDNGSTDDSLSGIIKFIDEKQLAYKLISGEDSGNVKSSESCVIIKSAENLGYGRGNNLGLRYALNQDDFEYAWIINNDLVFEKNALALLVNKYKSLALKKKVGLMGCKLKSYYDKNRIQTIGAKYNYFFCTDTVKGAWEFDSGQYDRDDIDDVIECPAGASLFAGKEFLLDCGLISEKYFIYFEEIDWALRSRRKGWELGYCWEADIYHKEGSSTGASFMSRRKKSRISDYHMVRSRILFAKSFFPKRLFFVYLGFIVTIYKRVIRFQFGRIPMILSLMYKGVFGRL